LEIKYIDYGCYSNKATDYSDWSAIAVKSIENKECTHLMLFCATGNGQNMFVNKSKHIRNAMIWNQYTAEMAIKHNCANSFSIPAMFTDENDLNKMIVALTVNNFSGSRHQNRVMKVMGLV
jgi:ribose 5-phosphate isomerase B